MPCPATPPRRLCRPLLLGITVALACGVASFARAQAVPEGFRCDFIYAAPDILHPSVMTCDDEGNLFVGEDPMDMKGPSTKEYDRVVLIRWDKQTGEPRKTVFCENLAAVFGLVWHEGALYVMHAPHYSKFEDTDGDGVADKRTDLATGFGPPAGVYGFNDHIVTGTRMGLDGLVYVSVGDKGIPKAVGADGSTLTLEGGGVVRMRLDGTQLEIVTSGTRNHLDVAMDSLDNIFTYDNTDDGLGWWTRFTHHMPTGYYGYPYDYLKHPERHLPRISEHGGGSPVGAAVYREVAWPEKYRESPFHCEWGKGMIQRFTVTPNGATFDATIEDFMTRQGEGEFRPQDLCFSPDGKHMYVADWNFPGWMQPKDAGRLFRVTYVGSDVAAEPARATNDAPLEAQLKSLGHPAHSERMRAQFALARLGKAAVEPVAALLKDTSAPRLARIHALWTQNQLLDRVDGYDPSADWIAVLKDGEVDVRSQAARALGLRRSKNALQPLVEALGDDHPTTRMQAAIALGRLGDATAAKPLFDALDEQDTFARFAMIQALRAIGDWSLAGEYLASSDDTVRGATLVALTGEYDDKAVAALAHAAEHAASPAQRAAAIAALGEVHRKADPYTGGWWGTQPARGEPSRPKQHEWSGSETIVNTLRKSLDANDELVVLAAVRALNKMNDPAALPFMVRIVSDTQKADDLREEILRMIVQANAPSAGELLAQIAGEPKTSTRLAIAALQSLATMKAQEGLAVAQARLADPAAPLRVAAIDAFAALQGAEASDAIAKLMDDPDAEVRRTAIRALGRIGAESAVPKLVEAASTGEAQFEAQLALASIPDRRAIAVYLESLASPNQELRNAARQAVSQLKKNDQLGDVIIQLHRRSELSPQVRSELQIIFSEPQPISSWHIAGPWSKDHDVTFDAASAPNLAQPLDVAGRSIPWQPINSDHPQGMISLTGDSNVWSIAYMSIESDADQQLPYAIGSDDQAILWVNGEKVYEKLSDGGWDARQGVGQLPVRKGTNHVWLQVGNTGGGYQFSLAVGGREERYAFLFENLPPKLDTSMFREFALQNTGDAERGAKLFADLQGVACIKCHAVAGEGGKIGPDLVGIGTKYPRDELVRSVLEPSNRVAESFQVTSFLLSDGRPVQGLIKSETADAIELVDAEGRTITVATDDIEERQQSTVSLMPNGLNEGMTLEMFADIIAYLESLKQPAPGK